MDIKFTKEELKALKLIIQMEYSMGFEDKKYNRVLKALIKKLNT